MSQILNLLRKDLRHNWPYIAVCLVAVATYTWHQARIMGTQQEFYQRDFTEKFWMIGTVVLLPVSWFLLIFRLVHSDGLVGDRQFWITRPYEWKNLLAAKALFIVVCINVPMLIVGVFLLSKAGFPPAPHWFGLVWMQLLLIQAALLPFFALAAVTRNLAEGLLVILGLVVFAACMLALDPYTSSTMSSSKLEDWLAVPITIAGCGAAVLLQYSGRKITAARLWLGTGAVVLALVSTTPLFMHADRDYPLTSYVKGYPFYLEIGTRNPEPPSDTGPAEGTVTIGMPIRTSSLPDGSIATVKGVRLSFEAVNGFRWTSGWRPQSQYRHLFAGANGWFQEFPMDRKTFTQVKSLPMRATISVAVDLFRDDGVKQIAAGDEEFTIPGVGLCRVDPQFLSSIWCHSPLLQPKTVLLRLGANALTCPAPEGLVNAPTAGEVAPAFFTHETSGPADYGYSPVQSFNLFFSSRERNDWSRARVCPGTPLLVSFPELVDRTTIEVEANEFKLENYRYQAASNVLEFRIDRPPVAPIK